MVFHSCNPSTLETDAGGLLNCIVRHCPIKKNRERRRMEEKERGKEGGKKEGNL
jgi:hypothetical protein